MSSTYQVLVKPNKKQNRVYWIPSDMFGESETIVVEITVPPIDGKANKEVIKLLADFFEVSKSCIKIQHGLKSKLKIVRIKS